MLSSLTTCAAAKEAPDGAIETAETASVEIDEVADAQLAAELSDAGSAIEAEVDPFDKQCATLDRNLPAGTACGDALSRCAHSCNGAGQCVAKPASGGTACGESGNPCDVSTCDGYGTCVAKVKAAGTVCPGPTDGCKSTQCNDWGKCVTAPRPKGALCGQVSVNSCSGDLCDGAGNCVVVNFDKGAQCGSTPEKSCKKLACDGDGACMEMLKDKGADCGGVADNNCHSWACDGAGGCQLSSSAAGTSCGTVDSSSCVQKSCDNAGQCSVNKFTAAGTVCGGPAGPCALLACDGNGSCSSTKPLPAGTNCNKSGNECADMQCDGLGTCQMSPKAGKACKIYDKCAKHQCDASGECVKLADSPTTTQCESPVGNPCVGKWCDGKGNCGSTVTTLAGVACQDPNACHGPGQCSADGFCEGPPLVGATCEPKGPCFEGAGTCNPEGECVAKPKPAGSYCGTGTSLCKAAACDGKGQCKLTKVGQDCGSSQYYLGDCHKMLCTEKGMCENVLTVGAACSTNKLCRKSGVCSPAGDCVQPLADAGTACPDVHGHVCLAHGTCDDKGECLPVGPVNVGAACDKGNPCVKGGKCDENGVCVGQTAIADGGLCGKPNGCVPEAKCKLGQCMYGEISPTACPPGSECGDNFCLLDNGKIWHIYWNFAYFSGFSSDEPGALLGTCKWQAGACLSPAAPSFVCVCGFDDATKTASDKIWQNYACPNYPCQPNGGQCLYESTCVKYPPVPCQEGKCDIGAGQCFSAAQPDGTSCGDGLVCKSGQCVLKPK